MSEYKLPTEVTETMDNSRKALILNECPIFVLTTLHTCSAVLGKIPNISGSQIASQGTLAFLSEIVGICDSKIQHSNP